VQGNPYPGLAARGRGERAGVAGRWAPFSPAEAQGAGRGAGGAPASPAATALLEPRRVCRARTVAHYGNYVALNLPRP
jgi:hypothetical protein